MPCWYIVVCSLFQLQSDGGYPSSCISWLGYHHVCRVHSTTKLRMGTLLLTSAFLLQWLFLWILIQNVDLFIAAFSFLEIDNIGPSNNRTLPQVSLLRDNYKCLLREHFGGSPHDRTICNRCWNGIAWSRWQHDDRHGRIVRRTNQRFFGLWGWIGMYLGQCVTLCLDHITLGGSIGMHDNNFVYLSAGLYQLSPSLQALWFWWERDCGLSRYLWWSS